MYLKSMQSFCIDKIKMEKKKTSPFFMVINRKYLQFKYGIVNDYNEFLNS